MVTLDKIRSDMKERFLIDKDLHMVDVRADTIDEALSDASVQLNTKISNLQYEVVERWFFRNWKKAMVFKNLSRSKYNHKSNCKSV